MSKKKNNIIKGNHNTQPNLQADFQSKYSFFPFSHSVLAYLILGVVSFLVYSNSIYNENALDDGIIIQKNEFVLRGTAGISDIMTRDSYYSFYRQMNAQDQLKGGRYRPLSVVTFAVEQEFLGTYNNGTFQKANDKNQNGTIEPEEVNSWVDKNKNAITDADECIECWDKNENYLRDTLKVKPLYKTSKYIEDINQDGNVNDKDCEVEGSMLRHTTNVLFYVFSILVLFSLLKNYFFRSKPDIAFLTTLLFAVHPIHTEVISNIKSRDEILSLLFICLTFIFAFKYIYNTKPQRFVTLLVSLICVYLAFEYKIIVGFIVLCVATCACLCAFQLIKNNKTAQLLTMAMMFWLALLSKEYAFTLLAILPMAVWLIVKDIKPKQYLIIIGAMGCAFLIYLAMRISSVTLKPGVPDTEILNNPYLLATPIQKVATKIFVLLKYLTLLFYPNPLSSDYSYNTIPYKTFADVNVWISLFVNIGLFVLGIKLFLKRNLISLAFIFYFAYLFMIGNIVFDIGATMGERLVYHSSLGVCLIIAWIIIEGVIKIIKTPFLQRTTILFLTLLVCAAASLKTYQRNFDWKNDITLFCHDVETVPNSVLVLGNAGARWIDKAEWPENKDSSQQYIKKAKGYLLHALDLHPKYVNGYLNLGLAYYKLNDLDSATLTWKNAEIRYPTNPYIQIYYNVLVPRLMAEAYEAGKAKRYDNALRFMNLAVIAKPNDAEVMYNMGGVYFSIGLRDSAMLYFEKCLKLKPDHQKAKEGRDACTPAIPVSFNPQ